MKKVMTTLKGTNEPRIDIAPSDSPTLFVIRDEAKEIGGLIYREGTFEFQGDAKESAKIFLQWLNDLGYHCPCCEHGPT